MQYFVDMPCFMLYKAMDMNIANIRKSVREELDSSYFNVINATLAPFSKNYFQNIFEVLVF